MPETIARLAPVFVDDCFVRHLHRPVCATVRRVQIYAGATEVINELIARSL